MMLLVAVSPPENCLHKEVENERIMEHIFENVSTIKRQFGNSL
jgi:hypothetical protein